MLKEEETRRLNRRKHGGMLRKEDEAARKKCEVRVLPRALGFISTNYELCDLIL